MATLVPARARRRLARPCRRRADLERGDRARAPSPRELVAPRRHGHVLPLEGSRARRSARCCADPRPSSPKRARSASRLGRRHAAGGCDRGRGHRRAGDDGRTARRRPRRGPAGSPTRSRERWPGSVDPAAVRTNIVCADLARLPARFVERLGERGVRVGTIDPRTVRFVTHKDVDDDAVARDARRLRRDAGPADVAARRDSRARARGLCPSRRPRDLGGRHARALGRRGRRGARRRHDARRQGHERSRRPTSTRSCGCGSRRPRPRRRVLGVTEHHHLDHPDGEIVDDRALRLELVRLIRTVRPDVVCCPDPTAVFFGDALRQPS